MEQAIGANVYFDLLMLNLNKIWKNYIPNLQVIKIIIVINKC